MSAGRRGRHEIRLRNVFLGLGCLFVVLGVAAVILVRPWIGPAYTSYLEIKGNLQADNDDLAGAERSYKAALRRDPQSHKALTGLGVLYLVRGDLDRAIELFERAYALDPTCDVIVSNLAVGHHYAGGHERRDVYAEEARRLGYPRMENLRGIFEGGFTIHTGENRSVRMDDRT